MTFEECRDELLQDETVKALYDDLMGAGSKHSTESVCLAVSVMLAQEYKFRTACACPDGFTVEVVPLEH